MGRRNSLFLFPSRTDVLEFFLHMPKKCRVCSMKCSVKYIVRIYHFLWKEDINLHLCLSHLIISNAKSWFPPKAIESQRAKRKGRSQAFFITPV